MAIGGVAGLALGRPSEGILAGGALGTAGTTIHYCIGYMAQRRSDSAGR